MTQNNESTIGRDAIRLPLLQYGRMWLNSLPCC